MAQYTITLTPEKLRDIYSCPDFRNVVAFAHGVYKRSDDIEPMHRITCSYPVAYIVTQEQIYEAGRELARAKAEALESNRGKLVLIGMGMVREDRPYLMNNYRVRGYFINRNGQKCFVEFMQGRNPDGIVEAEMLYPDFAMIEDVPIQQERKCFGLYTEENALRFVNQNFGCDFKELVIDNYTLSPEEIISDARQLSEASQ